MLYLVRQSGVKLIYRRPKHRSVVAARAEGHLLQYG